MTSADNARIIKLLEEIRDLLKKQTAVEAYPMLPKLPYPVPVPPHYRWGEHISVPNTPYVVTNTEVSEGKVDRGWD